MTFNSISKTAFVTVFQCRFCGIIVPFQWGAERHQDNCSFRSRIDLTVQKGIMTTVNFPCPLIKLERIKIKEASSEDKEKSNNEQSSVNHRLSSRLRIKKRVHEDDFWEPLLNDVIGPDESNEDSDFDEESEPRPKRRKKSDKLLNSNAASISAPGRKLKVMKPNNTMECPLAGCGAKLKNVQRLRVHFILHLQNNPYACTFPGCNVKCDAPSHLDRHMRLHTSTANIQCEICGVFFTRESRLKLHKCKNEFSKNKVKVKEYFDKDGRLRSGYAHVRLERSSSSNCDLVSFEQNKSNRKRIDLNAIFSADPVFQQLCKEKPEYKEILLRDGRHRNRKSSSRIPKSKFKRGSMRGQKISSGSLSDSEPETEEPVTGTSPTCTMVKTEAESTFHIHIKTEKPDTDNLNDEDDDHLIGLVAADTVIDSDPSNVKCEVEDDSIAFVKGENEI